MLQKVDIEEIDFQMSPDIGIGRSVHYIEVVATTTNTTYRRPEINTIEELSVEKKLASYLFAIYYKTWTKYHLLYEVMNTKPCCSHKLKIIFLNSQCSQITFDKLQFILKKRSTTAVLEFKKKIISSFILIFFKLVIHMF